MKNKTHVKAILVKFIRFGLIPLSLVVFLGGFIAREQSIKQPWQTIHVNEEKHESQARVQVLENLVTANVK
ncbi:hypothetical protein CI592_02070, partial [Fischerella thermalis CCMEE 5328]